MVQTWYDYYNSTKYVWVIVSQDVLTSLHPHWPCPLKTQTLSSRIFPGNCGIHISQVRNMTNINVLWAQPDKYYSLHLLGKSDVQYTEYLLIIAIKLHTLLSDSCDRCHFWPWSDNCQYCTPTLFHKKVLDHVLCKDNRHQHKHVQYGLRQTPESISPKEAKNWLLDLRWILPTFSTPEIGQFLYIGWTIP